jgi:hypothetical protein
MFNNYRDRADRDEKQADNFVALDYIAPHKRREEGKWCNKAIKSKSTIPWIDFGEKLSPA